jgi:hypothetical protein
MPSRLYKYLPARYVDDFVRRGRVLFRNLTYFRRYDTDASRGDLFEGRHVDRPGGGVKITNVGTGRTIEGDFASINSIQTDRVFVFCMSTRLDPDLYEAFEADACVEITSPAQFVKDCRRAIKKLPALCGVRLFHREVEYYKEAEAALGNVKDPTTIPFFKPARYGGQAEYRLMLANPVSTELTQRIVQGHALPGTESPEGESPKELWLRLRGDRQYMKTHVR